MKSLSTKTFQCGITVQGLTTLAGITYLTGITNTASWDHVIVGTTAQGQIYTRTYAQFMTDVATGIGLSGYVPTSRTLSINGTTYDLSANRSWTISTVDYTSRLQHQVKAGVAINKGQAVYVTSADGTNMIVGLASNASEATSSKTMGLLDATVTTNGFANVVTEGLLAGLDTSTAGTEGDPVWLGTGGNLIYGLANKPYAPAHLVFIGIVTRKNSNNGEIFVKVQNGFELNEIHDVDLKTNVPVNGELLGFNGTLWVNKTIAGWLGYTPANASGTTNYLSKFTGSTTLGNSLVYDNGTNVGIGTTSPAAKLDIRINEANTNTVPYLNLINDASGYVGYTFKKVGSNDLGLYGNYTTPPAMVWKYISGTDSYVGIGTATPAATLQVGNGSTGTNSLYVGGSVSTTHTIGFAVNGNTVYHGLTSNANSGEFRIGAGFNGGGHYIVLASGDNTERMRITPTGNVLIGTTTDSGYKLDVNGTTKTSGLIFSTGYLSGILYATTNASVQSAGEPNIHKYLGGLLSNAGATGDLYYYTGGLERLRITSAGNVGIGTSSPSEKLHIFGNLRVQTSAAANTASTATIELNPETNTPAYIQAVSNFGPTSPTVYSAGLKFIVTNRDASLPSPYYSIDALSILANGNIGIGTTTPSSLLHVKSTAAIADVAFFQSSTNGLCISFNGSRTGFHTTPAGVFFSPFFGFTGGSNVQIGLGNEDALARLHVRGSGTTSSTIALLVQNSTPNTLLQVEDGGTTRITGPTPYLMVGVPSNQSPTSRLTVGGSGLFTYDGYSNAGGFYIDQGGTSNASRTLWYDGAGTVKNLITGNGNSYITAGNLGIGTTTPIYNLEVSSTGYTGLGIMSGANSIAEIGFQNRGYGLPRWTIRAVGAPDGSSGNLTFQRLGSTFPLTLTSGENVLIGTTTDSGYKLDVNGTVRVNDRAYIGEDVTFTSSQYYYLISASSDGLLTFTNNTVTQGNAQGFISGELYLAGSAAFLNHRAINIITTNRNTNTSNIVRAFYASGRTGQAGAANTVAGFLGGVNIEGSGNVTNAIGLEVEILSQTNNKTITNMYGVKVQPLVNSVGTITNTYGVYIDSLTAGTQTNAAYGIYQAGTDRNYFGGNVGIGTTSPTEKLTVNGNTIIGLAAQLGTENAKLKVKAGYEGGAMNGALIQANGATSTLILKHTGNASNSILIDNTDAGSTGMGAGIRINASNNITNFVNFSNSGSTKFFIAGNGDIYVSGSLGIGTTSPTYKLDVVGNTRLTDSAAQLIINNATYSELSYGTGNYFRASGSSAVINGPNIQLLTGGSERLRVDGAGNVGIGTSSPSYKLHVNADGAGLYVLGANSAPYTQTIASFVYGGNGNSINIENQGGKASLQARAGASTMALQLNVAGGNVLVGTATDSGYNLQVAGNQLITTTGNTSSTTGFKILNSSGSTMFHVLDNGNVGININAEVSSPYSLRVNGGIWANSFEQLQTLNGTAGVGSIEYYNTGGSHRTLGFRTYGSHPAESVKGFIEISSQVLTYTGIGNVVLHADADFADHPTLVLRSLNTSADSFYMQNYHHSQGALFITKAATGGDSSMRFRPGRSSDILVISTSGILVNGVITATGGNSTNWNTAYSWGNHSSAGYVPQARTLTINGTSYDLSANRSWTIATTTPGGSNTQFQYNSSGTLAGASALTYDSGTNRVGINQASPGYDLDVNGQVRVQDKLRVGNVNSGNGVVHMSSTATINPSATTIVWSQNVSVGMCAFIEYYILNNNTTTDQRAGTIMVTWNQSGTPTIAHTETTTPDIGSTIAVTFTSSLVGSDARINAVNSSSAPYTIVMSYRYF